MCAHKSVHPSAVQREDLARAAQFLLHASLDMVDMQQWASNATYLKVVDRHNEQMVSAYVTPGGARFLLLHEARNEDGIRLFCTDVHDAYCKLLMNPFYAPGTSISSREFDTRVRAAARRYLGWKAA